jgi:hypothetical protein
LILLTSFSFAQYPLIKKLGKDSVVIMTIQQGNQINESFDNNEKTISLLRDSLKLLRFNLLQTNLVTDTLKVKKDTLFSMYQEIKWKHDKNIEIYKSTEKKWKQIYYYQEVGSLIAISLITLFISLTKK